jgi:hypothetical protein
MLRKFLTLLLAGLLLQLACVQPANAETKAEKDARFIEKMKAGIAHLGTGAAARVEVKLRDNTKLKGYISEATDDHFVIMDASGKATEVAYQQVKGIKGHNLSTGAKTAIFISILAAALLIPILILKSGGSRT